jgi:hypothetical protein
MRILDRMPDLTAQRNLFFLNSSISFGICDLKDTAAVIKDVRGTKQKTCGPAKALDMKVRN